MRKITIAFVSFAAAFWAAGNASAQGHHYPGASSPQAFVSKVSHKKAAAVKSGKKKHAKLKKHHKHYAKAGHRHRRHAYGHSYDSWFPWRDINRHRAPRRYSGWYHEPYPDHVGDGPYPQWIMPDGTLSGPIPYPANGG